MMLNHQNKIEIFSPLVSWECAERLGGFIQSEWVKANADYNVKH